MSLKKQKRQAHGKIVNFSTAFQNIYSETGTFKSWINELLKTFNLKKTIIETQYQADYVLLRCTMNYSLSSHQLNCLGPLRSCELRVQLSENHRRYFSSEKTSGDLTRQNIIYLLYSLSVIKSNIEMKAVVTLIFRAIDDYCGFEDTLNRKNSLAFLRDVFSILWYYVEKWEK